ncbi:hypothetical protein HHK36_020150 [Tetracentron sinense]|uniref:Uncharacterized protein n=1 Tax=Tetracentron sinense TaxID=13715 RepID=A0A835D7S2_TETSI|nr:hypothetical protein HHK36_020150 [Tetracentron sinense]
MAPSLASSPTPSAASPSMAPSTASPSPACSPAPATCSSLLFSRAEFLNLRVTETQILLTKSTHMEHGLQVALSATFMYLEFHEKSIPMSSNYANIEEATMLMPLLETFKGMGAPLLLEQIASLRIFSKEYLQERHVKALFTEKVIHMIEKAVGCKIKMEEKFIIVNGKDRLCLTKCVDVVHMLFTKWLGLLNLFEQSMYSLWKFTGEECDILMFGNLLCTNGDNHYTLGITDQKQIDWSALITMIKTLDSTGLQDGGYSDDMTLVAISGNIFINTSLQADLQTLKPPVY